MARQRNPFLPLLVVALIAGGGWLYAGPHLALRKLQRAADAGDTRAMNELVDFPALRSSVKENVNSSVSRELSDRTGLPGVGALGGYLAGRVVNTVVDAAVTPAGVAALASGRLPNDDEAEDGEGRRKLPDGLKREFGYEGMNHFEVRYVDRESGAERVALIMTRAGLDWKLTAVRFGAADER